MEVLQACPSDASVAGGLVGRLTALLYDRMCRRLEEVTLSEWRRDLLAPLSGEVLEIGAGTGLNIPWYPTTVTHLIPTEPDPHMGVRLRSKIPLAQAHRITTLDAAVDALPIASGSIDAVVVTFVLCSVPDQHSALTEYSGPAGDSCFSSMSRTRIILAASGGSSESSPFGNDSQGTAV